MSNPGLADELGRLLLCLSQALMKCDEDPDMNYVRLGLGEYVLEIHQAEHVLPEKRIQLMSEVLYCTDRDHLSKNQFFESVMSLKSSDEVRHWLYKVQNFLRKSRNNIDNSKSASSLIQSHSSETPRAPNPKVQRAPDERYQTYNNYLHTVPTFEDRYPHMQHKKIKLTKKEWSFENFLLKVLDFLYESATSNIELLQVAHDKIIYQTSERPNEERELISDIQSILNNDGLDDIPISTALEILELILSVFDYEDKQSMPKNMIDNLMSVSQDFPKFNKHIIFE